MSNSTKASIESSLAKPTVFVVDDDAEFRESIRLLLESVNLKSETFPSAQEFVARYQSQWRGCLLADVRMPGMSGLELQKWLTDKQIHLPIILITAHAEVPMAVEVMRSGAVDFLEKPYSPQQLLERIQQALKQDAERHQELAKSQSTRSLLAALSPREQQVLDLLLDGRNAKEIANRLKLSTKTIDFHRRNLMEKLQVESLVELGRLVERHARHDTSPSHEA